MTTSSVSDRIRHFTEAKQSDNSQPQNRSGRAVSVSPEVTAALTRMFKSPSQTERTSAPASPPSFSLTSERARSPSHVAAVASPRPSSPSSQQDPFEAIYAHELFQEADRFNRLVAHVKAQGVGLGNQSELYKRITAAALLLKSDVTIDTPQKAIRKCLTAAIFQSSSYILNTLKADLDQLQFEEIYAHPLFQEAGRFNRLVTRVQAQGVGLGNKVELYKRIREAALLLQSEAAIDTPQKAIRKCLTAAIFQSSSYTFDTLKADLDGLEGL